MGRPRRRIPAVAAGRTYRVAIARSWGANTKCSAPWPWFIQAIWDAITSSEWTTKYGYQGPVDYDLRPGGAFRAHATPQMRQFGLPDVVVDGEVIESNPPHKLVQTYRFLFNDAHKAEGFTRLTWEIAQSSKGFCRLTVTHELEGAPVMATMVKSPFSEMGTGGWPWILSDMKSLLETGSSM